MAATAPMQTNLEVEVSDFPGVEVVDALQDLLDELSGLFLTQRLLLGQKVKQLTARDATRERESSWVDSGRRRLSAWLEKGSDPPPPTSMQACPLKKVGPNISWSLFIHL